MQKTQIIGRVGNDAEVKTLDNGSKVISFNVACTENWKNKQGEKQSKTTWYECSKWGEYTGVSQYIKKGTQIYVEGVSEVRAWMSDGEAKAKIGIKVSQIELLGDSKSDVPF